MIYLIKERGTDYYKIGYTSRNSERRLQELQTGNPRMLEVVATIDGDENKERLLHHRYAHLMSDARNEWFKLTDNHVKDILNSEQDLQDTGSVIRSSPFDVRQVRWRQRHDASAGRKDVPKTRWAIDHASPKHFFYAYSTEQQQRSEDVMGEKGEAGVDGNIGIL